MLNHLSNTELTNSLKNLVQKEREVLNQVLEHLEEMEKRRLYLTLGFSSLFEYCTKELGYSEGAAQRRISSMRLIKEIPQVKEKIESGKLNLTTISMAQSFFRREEKEQKTKYTSFEKHELLKTLETKSKREVEKELVKINPLSALPKEKERLITPDTFEIKFTLTQKQMEKLKRLKELKPDLLSNQEALDWLLDRVLKQIDPMKFNIPKELKHKAEDKGKYKSSDKNKDDGKNEYKILDRNMNFTRKIGAILTKVDSVSELRTASELGQERVDASFETARTIRYELNDAPEMTKNTKKANRIKQGENTSKTIRNEIIKEANKQMNELRNELDVNTVKNQGGQNATSKFRVAHSRKYISKFKKALVWNSANSQCEYTSPITKKRCSSKSSLQIDHIHPLALGGTDDLENLRLLCQQHNISEAIKNFGRKKMSAYLID